jgi:hypothetical protein
VGPWQSHSLDIFVTYLVVLAVACCLLLVTLPFHQWFGTAFIKFSLNQLSLPLSTCGSSLSNFYYELLLKIAASGQY